MAWIPERVSYRIAGRYAFSHWCIRANQGDCVKMTLRNQMESEDGSLPFSGSSMMISATGKAGHDDES